MTNLIANHPTNGLPTVHAAECGHALRGLVTEAGVHSIRVGTFASCVSTEVQQGALVGAFNGWMD